MNNKQCKHMQKTCNIVLQIVNSNMQNIQVFAKKTSS